ncbi:hypothetical protein PIB30_040164 [Stylosanthes scabra]|uniref:Uncharacterized protein n=1 Tax=Stylosanthes scabra TaxID=79078 RepID=A0ABU6XCZ1_9FABA|nr:hypothetical protein [Stylosanthes scabra]
MRGRECLIAAGLWWIWRRRCNVIFSLDLIWTPLRVALLARHSASEFVGFNLSDIWEDEEPSNIDDMGTRGVGGGGSKIAGEGEEDVRPYLISHGGNIEMVYVEDGVSKASRSVSLIQAQPPPRRWESSASLKKNPETPSRKFSNYTILINPRRRRRGGGDTGGSSSEAEKKGVRVTTASWRWFMWKTTSLRL